MTMYCDGHSMKDVHNHSVQVTIEVLFVLFVFQAYPKEQILQSYDRKIPAAFFALGNRLQKRSIVHLKPFT